MEKIIVMAVDGNIFLNSKHIVSMPDKEQGMDAASALVEALENVLGEELVDFQFN